MTALTKALAIALIRKHSWPTDRDKSAGECPSCGSGLGDFTRRMIHVRSGFGCDLDVEAVVALIETDADVIWRPPGGISLGHDLLVRDGDRWMGVEVHRPDPGCSKCKAAELAVVGGAQ